MPDRVQVCRLEELEPGAARRFVLQGRAVAVVRIDDEVYAIGDTCSHEETSLAEGEVWPEERELECPKHGSTFDLVTGEPRTLPATEPVPVYPVTVVDGVVELELP